MDTSMLFNVFVFITFHAFMARFRDCSTLQARDAKRYLAVDPKPASPVPIVTLAAFSAGDVRAVDLANLLASMDAPDPCGRPGMVECLCILPAPSSYLRLPEFYFLKEIANEKPDH